MRHRETIFSAATFLFLTLLATAPWSEVKMVWHAPAPSPSVPDAAGAIALAWVPGQDQALPSDLVTLLAMLQMGDVDIREHAAAALGRLGDTRALKSLVLAIMKDRDPRVREHACTALGDLRNETARLPLTQVMLDDPDASVREHAAYALGMLGNPGALDALRKAQRDPDSDVRHWAAAAIRKIRRR